MCQEDTMRTTVLSLLAALALIFSLSLVTPSTTHAGQRYSSQDGGNCDRGLRGPSSPCDGYGPGGRLVGVRVPMFINIPTCFRRITHTHCVNGFCTTQQIVAPCN